MAVSVMPGLVPSLVPGIPEPGVTFIAGYRRALI
jgi:hypothetical protein